MGTYINPYENPLHDIAFKIKANMELSVFLSFTSVKKVILEEAIAFLNKATYITK